MKKKNLLLAVTAALCVSYAFTGCGSDDSDSSNETTTEAKEEAGIVGYWETADSQIPAYYHITENSMELITMGIQMQVGAKIGDSEITMEMLGETSTVTYELDGDVLKITEDGETTEFKRITEDDYNAILAEIEAAEDEENDDEDESEDPGVNGYVVAPGVEMTIEEDDGSIVVYANDGDGTYIKSITYPDETSDNSLNGNSSIFGTTVSDENATTAEVTEEDTTATNTTTSTGRHAAFANNPYLADLELPMTLTDMYKELGDANKPGDSWDVWKTADGYTITAYHKDGSVWKVEALPGSLSIWFESDIDFSKVDTSKSYTYEELSALIGSAGAVHSVTNVNGTYKYTIIWYKSSSEVFTADFDMNTDTTIYISK